MESENTKKLHIAIFASHRGTNMQAIIDACKIGDLNGEICAVISNNSNSQALEKARIAGIPEYHLSNKTHPEEEELDEAICKVLTESGADIVALAGYMKKLGPKVLKQYKGRILNIHPSLLPKYGGKGMYGIHVHRAVIDAGENTTGVTIHLVEEEYDAGKIIRQCEIEVLEGDTIDTLSKKVLEKENSFYVETLRLISEGVIKL
ncbi:MULTISPECIES: phosphoribosylglycinamide formyltransferase [Methanosarcina]|uniref:phosphoribosylglycinamide formyltransferase 1 n=1 Tax=Methanosarcina vacuolata Z-761 TaxID=1434123 RepID=A0A0E3Q7G5_9EURY|nr:MULTISPECIES: phosphoribosylglycinamide formyltransferase [Methanosarcina]AKB45583.1 Phosphoribosylglycinamide formyltransferase [Methanosarcina vacuolata Z-761]AKB49051.1 Phosphoribosylglycinamide formyltransferase [Methanosarcina sp. Kolksee]